MPVQNTNPMSVSEIERTLDEAWESVFFNSKNERIDWEYLSSIGKIPSLYVKTNWRIIGYIENINVYQKSQYVWIGHFATVRDFRGARLGRPMAFALRKAISKYFQFTRIMFQENHHDFWEINYNNFFEKLGAVPRRGTSPYRPAWVWEWGEEREVTGEEWRGGPPTPNPPPPPFIAGG